MPGQGYDAVVVGGGPVGCAAAIALAGAGAKVAVLEAQAERQPAPQSRTLALSWNSRLILERFGAWQHSLDATPINTIHVSHRGHFGRAQLDRADLGLPALGYVVRFADLYDALLLRTEEHDVTYRYGFTVNDIDTAKQARFVSGSTAKGEEKIRAELVVVADGGSALAKAGAAKVKTHDYSQHAVVGLVQPDRPHRNKAFERFAPDGPIALLPCDEEYAFVWTCKPQDVPELLGLTDPEFLLRLREAFGDRAGRFANVRLRSAFPLMLRVARERDREGIVLLGNAAQTLHPIAGQGFNLGLRDAWDLAQILASVPSEAIGDADVTAKFRKKRLADRSGAIAFTDSLARTFSNDFGPLALARGLGLAALDALPPIKRSLMHQMIFGTGN